MESYTEKINLNLDQKVFHFFEVFDTFYQRMNGQVYGAFSGGRDSTVMKYLIDRFLKSAGYPPIKYVFNNTTNEHKEILDFVKTFGDQITWIRPKMTFAQTLEKYGFPLVSKSQAMAISRYRNTKREDQKIYRLTGKKADGTRGKVGVISRKWQFMINAPFKVTERCCDILKKEPVKRFEKESGLRPIIGTMAEESNLRKMIYLKEGCNVFKKGKESCRPLSIFTDQDIEDLINKFDIEICSIYSDQIIDGELVPGEKRTGCAYCGMGCHLEDQKNNRFHRLKKREPKRYASFMDKLGYREALKFTGITIPGEEKEESQLKLKL